MKLDAHFIIIVLKKLILTLLGLMIIPPNDNQY